MAKQVRPRAMTRFSSSSLDRAMRVKMEPSPGGVFEPRMYWMRHGACRASMRSEANDVEMECQSNGRKAAAVCESGHGGGSRLGRNGFDGHGQFENGALAGRALDSDDAVHS